jgi:enediyne biosynthesis protein E4
VYDPGGKGMGMACADFDNDGDTDIFVANDLTPNFLYRNNGDGTFTDVALLAGVAYNGEGKLQSSMGVDFGDYDNDGYLDLIVPGYQGEGCTLYHNSGSGYFTDESVASGIGLPTRQSVCWGAGFIDCDNDGDLDLYVAAGHVLDNAELFFADVTYKQRNFLFRNDGPGPDGHCRFTDVSAASGPGLAVVQSSRGTAFADYDHDGDLDVLVSNCTDTPSLLRNDGGSLHRWLQVQPLGTTSNRDGLGVRVEVTAGGITQVRELKSGSSLYSQSERVLHFGLGDQSVAATVRVRWPGGPVDTYHGVAAGARMLARQGGRLERLPAGRRP